MALVCPKRERLPSNDSIESDPADIFSLHLGTRRRVTSDTALAFIGSNRVSTSDLGCQRHSSKPIHNVIAHHHPHRHCELHELQQQVAYLNSTQTAGRAFVT